MRARFLATAGPSEQLDDLCRRRGWDRPPPAGWKRLLRVPGLLVLARRGESALVFPDGAIIGTLLETRNDTPIEQPSGRLAADIAASGGQVLVDRCWGAWFAIFSTGSGYWAARDPSAFSPAYQRQEGSVSVWFSDLETASLFDCVPPGIDPLFLRHWLGFPHLRTARTGIEGVSELLAGMRHEVGRDGLGVSATWTPWRFAEESPLHDFEAAARAVRERALQVIPAQARGRDNLLLELSGGLDSSIVAAALKTGGVPFETLNFVTRAAEGDERRYARAVADATSDRHHEIGEGDAVLDLAVPERRRLRPGLNPVTAPIHRQFAEHAAATGGRTCLTGAGGDNVFCYLTTSSPVIDAWRRRGAGAALRALQDVSELCGCTIWTTSRFALRKAARELRGANRWRRETDFLLEEAVPSQPEPHPWLDFPRRSLPGKREQVAALLRIQHVVDPETRIAGPDFLHPLIAQPLIELCLRILTWLWVRGGHNRAVARRAFQDLLPGEVLARRGKGGLESLCVRAYAAHRGAISDLLLGGLLRDTGLLDPDALEAYLALEGPPPDARYFRIFELVAAELWLRSWR